MLLVDVHFLFVRVFAFLRYTLPIADSNIALYSMAALAFRRFVLSGKSTITQSKRARTYFFVVLSFFKRLVMHSEFLRWTSRSLMRRFSVVFNKRTSTSGESSKCRCSLGSQYLTSIYYVELHRVWFRARAFKPVRVMSFAPNSSVLSLSISVLTFASRSWCFSKMLCTARLKRWLAQFRRGTGALFVMAIFVL